MSFTFKLTDGSAKKLDELNKEELEEAKRLIDKALEDYEELKDHYYIGMIGVVNIVEALEFTSDFIDDKIVPQLKQVGNYFETKEEAEKAVEKLKAWKRLKDKGFEFKGGDDACISYEFPIEKWNSELEKDFELLFGGEE